MQQVLLLLLWFRRPSVFTPRAPTTAANLSTVIKSGVACSITDVSLSLHIKTQTNTHLHLCGIIAPKKQSQDDLGTAWSTRIGVMLTSALTSGRQSNIIVDELLEADNALDLLAHVLLLF